MIVRGIVKEFADLIANAEQHIIEDMGRGDVEQEASITDRFFGEVHAIFRERGQKEGIEFHARTLGDRGTGSPESEFGADICGVLDVRMKNYEQSKGFLSQSKIEGPTVHALTGYRQPVRVTFSPGRELVRLNGQIDKMLSVTPDSFVIVYRREGFVVVPGSSVKGLKGNAPLHGKSIRSFFAEFLMCFVGDPRLKARDDGTLGSLRRDTRSRLGVLFQITETSQVDEATRSSA